MRLMARLHHLFGPLPRGQPYQIATTHQEVVAALGWWGFHRVGRGALVAPPPAEATVELGRCWPLGHDRAAYVAAAPLLRLVAQRMPTMITDITTMITQYRPTREVVVVCCADNSPITATCLCLDVDVAPPFAYARWRARLHDALRA